LGVNGSRHAVGLDLVPKLGKKADEFKGGHAIGEGGG
jgi:hypothetical protein